MQKRSSKPKNSTHSPFHADEYLSKIDKIALDQSLNKYEPRHLSSSVKLLNKQIKSISSTDTKFTKSPVYLEGKSKLEISRNSIKNETLISNFTKILENPDPKGLDTLTLDIMNSKLAKKILQQKKKSFGSSSDLLYPEDRERNFNYRSMSKEQSDLLKKIIYNFKFLNSSDAKNQKILHFNKKKVIREPQGVSTVSSSPVKLKSRKKDNLDEMNIEENYQKAIKKHDLENGLMKVRLSKIISLRNVFR